jgi:hypothetical protein
MAPASAETPPLTVPRARPDSPIVPDSAEAQVGVRTPYLPSAATGAAAD